MKEIINLLGKENKLKLKLLGYQLLLLVTLILAMIIPLVVSLSFNENVALVGTVAIYIILLLYSAASLYVCINDILVDYYENFEISFVESLKKVVASLLLILSIIIAFLIPIIIVSLILTLFNSTLMYLIVGLMYVILVSQMNGFIIAIFYITLESVDNNKKGFLMMFKSYFRNIFLIRKECVKIGFRTSLVFLIACLAMLIISIIVVLVAINTSLSGHLPQLMILLMIFIILLIWVLLTVYVYMFKRYIVIGQLITNWD